MITEPRRTLTMQDAITFVEAHGTRSQKQDIRKAKSAFSIHGFEGPDFDRFPATLIEYEKAVPKLRGSMPALQSLIRTAGISDQSYKQFQRAGRRLIEAVTGARSEKAARKNREDHWANLLRQVDLLGSAGLVRSQNRVALTFLVDFCRAAEIAPQALTIDQVMAWRETADTAQRKKLLKGVKALDTLRDIDRLRPLLPLSPVTPQAKPAGRLATLPQVLQCAINGWVDVAARDPIQNARYAHLAEPLSPKTRATYSAALSLYVQTLLKLEPNLRDEAHLRAMFSEPRIDMVFADWCNSGAHAARTLTKYARTIGAVLDRNDQPDTAAYLVGLTNALPHLIEGRSAEKTMSPKVKKWCGSLLRDPQKTVLFQVQHLEYYRRALEGLEVAKRDGRDLLALSKPQALAILPAKERYSVKKILRKVRMFGLMAAYSAIALEGAPFRRQNMLTMRHSGHQKTMHLHLTGRSPHVVIKFPNSELKNGRFLSERGEELEAITIEKRGEGDHAIEIIDFYLREIRPLFPESDKTHAFFPPLKNASNPEFGFVAQTFYIWLSEASSEIGLPMNSHNYRHGYCSIDINEGRRSMEDLAKILGDTVSVVQRNYAWVNAKKSVLNVQKDTARRRAEILKARGAAT